MAKPERDRAERDRDPEFPERGPVHEFAEGEVGSYERYVNYRLLVV